MAEMPFDTWYALWSIQQECEGYRFGQPSYDSTLDHIYELAAGVLADLDGGVLTASGGVPTVSSPNAARPSVDTTEGDGSDG